MKKNYSFRELISFSCKNNLKLTFTILLLFFISNTWAQKYSSYYKETWPESDEDTLVYTVKGERHGVSFFFQHSHPEVEYKAGEKLTFDRYHTVDVMYTWMKRWAKEYPDLIDLYEVAKSFEGRPILQITLTNKKTGKDTDKPAAFFEGGRHSGESTSSESVFWLLNYLLRQYGNDEAITRLIDTKTLYLRPHNNPDGSNLYLFTSQRNRSTVRPFDNDGDGLLDEDSEDDMDGDGIIYSIRWKPGPDDEVKGDYILDERDPTGRLMKRAPEGEGVWRVITEGYDNDGDGIYNEDGIGGLDLHRNYPENWRPGSGLDKTGRGFTQRGAGAFPLSETETRSVFLFLITHPNVSVANSMDTRVPMHLRPPSTSKSSEGMFPEDLVYYEYFDSVGKSITNYPWAGDVYENFMTRYPISQWTGEPSKPSPLFGHGPDFGYSYYGAIWYGDELWNGGAYKDYNDDKLLDNADALIWDDTENNGAGFREWEPFEHPDFGEVEIGGFHPKFFSQNGPPSRLEEWARNQAFFNLQMAMGLPQLELNNIKIEKTESDKDSTSYFITISWTNTGILPTALKQAHLIKIVREDMVRLDFDKELTGSDKPKLKIISPSGRDKTISTGYTQPGETKEVKFEVRTYDVKNVEGTVKILSTRGGVLEEIILLGDKK